MRSICLKGDRKSIGDGRIQCLYEADRGSTDSRCMRGAAAVLVPLYEEERVSEDEVIHALYTAAGIGR